VDHLDAARPGRRVTFHRSLYVQDLREFLLAKVVRPVLSATATAASRAGAGTVIRTVPMIAASTMAGPRRQPDPSCRHADTLRIGQALFLLFTLL